MTSTPGQIHTALFVDSHDDTRDLYAAYFAQRGVRLRTAGCLRDALPLLPGSQAVITELHLQGGSGIDVLHAAHSIPGIRDVPLIVLTACTSAIEVALASEAGCDTVLVKPVLPEDLLTSVHRAIERRTSRRALSTHTGASAAHSRHPL